MVLETFYRKSVDLVSINSETISMKCSCVTSASCYCIRAERQLTLLLFVTLVKGGMKNELPKGMVERNPYCIHLFFSVKKTFTDPAKL